MSGFKHAAAAGLAALLAAGSGAVAAEAETQQALALVSDGVAPKPAGDASCPTVTLAPDGDSRRLEGAKATLDGLARDCANLGAETIVKVALVGESERRRRDGPAAIEAPMTIQIKDGAGREIETRRINLKVEMPEGVQRVSFRHVEENVSLPPASADGYANWVIIVGLDPSAEPEVAAAEEVDEAPVKAERSSKRSRKSRYRANRSTRAAIAAARRQAPPVTQQSDVVLSAKPQTGAPGAQITTNLNGGPMARAANSFTERRETALQKQRAVAAQQAAQARRQGRQPQQAQATAPAQTAAR